MITSGLVITLSTNAELAAQAVAKVSARTEFTLGERNDRWLPAAMEAHDDAASRDLHDWLHALLGVEYVDVVSVNFEDEELSPTAHDGQILSEPDRVLSRNDIPSMNRFQHRGSEDTEKGDASNLCVLQNSVLKFCDCETTTTRIATSPAQLASDRTNQVNHEH